MTLAPNATAKRILVVHEDSAVRAALVEGATYAGIDSAYISEAASYSYVLEQLEARRFDLILFHLNLPDEDPFSLVDSLSVFAPRVPLVALSVNATEETVCIVRELGCADFLPLPCDRGAVIATVHRLLTDPGDATSGAARQGIGPRVLVVDDDELVRYTINAVLKSVAEVTSAASPSEALSLLATSAFDVMLVDLKMDEMDGVTLVHHVKRIRPDIVILVVTGFPDMTSAIASFREGAFEYLVKPLEPAVLRTAVSRAWGQHTVNRQRYRLFRELQKALEGQKSKARELHAARYKLSEIVDHIRPAVVVFGADGIVEALQSRAARKLFGEVPAGTKVSELLFDDGREWSTKRQLFDLWLEVAFEVDESDWPEVHRAALTEITLGSEGVRQSSTWLELEWRPIFEDGHVARILLIATDVSEERRLALDIAAQQTRYDAELSAMRRLIAGSGPAFAEFLHTSDGRIAECRRILEGCVSPHASAERLLGIVHTLRGEARAFDLDDLAVQCALIESVLSPYQRAPSVAGDGTSLILAEKWDLARTEVLERLSRADQAIGAARDLFVVASPTGRVALDQVTVRRSDMEWLGQVTRGRGDDIEAAVRALTSRPFGECCAPIEGKANYWSEQEGKPLLLTIIGRDVAVPAELAAVLGGVLAHLVRNCIAHGLETDSERMANGKAPLGSIELSAESPSMGGDVVIRVSDDGRGVNEAALRSRASATPLGQLSVHELLFAPGLSTADARTELSGLGVGLSAVRDGLRAIGYDVHASWQAGQGTSFVLARVPLAGLSSAPLTPGA